MGQTRVRYIVMTKPIHSVYGQPVPGLGRASYMPSAIPLEDLETIYFKETRHSCGGGCCNTVIHPMELEPWVVFEICSSLEEAGRAVKRALNTCGEENIVVLQDIPVEVQLKFQ